MKKYFIILLILFTGSCVKNISPSTGKIWGVVKDAKTLEPVAGCAITLVPSGRTTTTGSDGVFHFEDVPPEQYSIEASSSNYSDNKKSIIVAAGESVNVDILLTPLIPDKGAVSGVVKDAKTLEPVAGCAVTLVPTGNTSITGSDGVFHFENVPSGQYSIEANSNNYYNEKKNITVTAGGSINVDILLALFVPDKGVVGGVVKNSQTLEPVSGCVVTLVPTGNTSVTGGDGVFHFYNIPSGQYSVEANNNNYYNDKKNIIVTAGESVNVDFLLAQYDTNERLPMLSEVTASDITHNSARLLSEVVDPGSSSISDRGFLYSEMPNPSMSNATRKSVQSGTGVFYVTVTELKENTEYYVVSYAINARGTAYSDQIRFKTGDGTLTPAPTGVIYVSVSGNDSNDGSAWNRAKKTIHAAVSVAEKGKQIWVSAGSFNEILSPKAGVNIYGGFNGTETSVDQRTGRTAIDAIRCSYDNEETTVMNGFSVSNLDFWEYMLSSPVFLGANYILENCLISGNEDFIAVIEGDGVATLKNCIIENNRSENIIDPDLDNITMINCIIRGNAGAIAGKYMYNCVITNNSSFVSGNMYNCTVASNSGKAGGVLYNCLVWNNNVTDDIRQNSCITVATANNNGVRLKSPSSTKGSTANDWQTADWSITTGSTCINAGTNLYFPTGDIPVDVAGNPRITGNTIDVGAYEW
jgi:hypothetical protein